MKLIATSSGSDRPLPDTGMQHAVLYSVIYLGTQKTEYKGKVKFQAKLNVAWELPTMPQLEYEDNDGKKIMRPQCIFKSYTLSLFEKANLAKDLAGWRGKGFTKEEEKGFDVFTMLKPGTNALLQIVHYEGNDGKTRATYHSINNLMPGMKDLLPENEIIAYEVGMRDNFPNGMPDWAKDAAKDSREYKAMANAEEGLSGGIDGSESPPAEDTTDYNASEPDGIPY